MKSLRKSFKGCLKRANLLWKICILHQEPHYSIEEFQVFHRKVAERVTRSQETWDLMQEAVRTGDAFVIEQRDTKGVLVGASLFPLSSYECQYGVGVYSRELFDEPISHQAQMHAVEFMTYEFTSMGGISYNEKAETSVRGLYAAGDEYFGGISCAAVFGWIAGEDAARYSKEAPTPKMSKASDKTKATISLITGIRKRQDGPDWKEAKIEAIKTGKTVSELVEEALEALIKENKRK